MNAIGKMIRTYSELIRINNYEDRFRYLSLDGKVGVETFGSSRYLNQYFYSTNEWKRFRREVIIRDNGMDMGLDGYPIHGSIYIHHINPISKNDILDRNVEVLLDFENVICVSSVTHQAIHYGDVSLLDLGIPVIRKPNDTCPWKK